jgi:hypothetical protein
MNSKKTLITLITVLISAARGLAQDIHFLKSYGNTGYDYGRDIKQTSDTGYIATGSSSSFGSADADAFLLKVDSLGNFKWSYNYGGPGSDWGHSLVITYDSSYAIGGFTNSFGAGGFDFYLVRADINGIPLWEKTYGGTDWDRAYSLAPVPADSGFVLVGETQSFGNGGSDIYIVRTDKNGDTLWTKTYGGTFDDYGKGVLVDGDSIVVCGGTKSYGAGMTDGIIIKMGIDGNMGWVKYAGQDKEDWFTSVIKSSGIYAFAGSRDYHNGVYLNDFWLYRTSANGQILVVDTTISNASHEVETAHDITTDIGGNFYFAGQTMSFGYSTIDFLPDAFIGRINTAYYTDVNYRQNFGEAGTDIAWGIDRCYDKGMVAIGDLQYQSTGGTNMFIIKLNQTAYFPDDSPDYDIFGPINNPITNDIDDLTNVVNNDVVRIYPNPVSDVLFIELQTNEPYRVILYDIYGRIIKDAENCNQIPTGDLESGMYVLKMIVVGREYSYRIIKR